MTATEYLNKHPKIRKIVNDTVKQARQKQMSPGTGIALLRRRLSKAIGQPVENWIAEEFWIA